MKPHSLRNLARRIRETGLGMSHRRSREISEKMALDLEKKAEELEQLAQENDELPEARQDKS
jgi:hypothetical protein